MDLQQPSKHFSKYAKIELVFFLFFFFLFPILTDVEYKLKESPCAGCDDSFANTIIQRLVFGLFQIPPYLFLYKIILHKLLLKKKYLYFFVAFILFLFALNLYTVYVQYWTISQLTFLPENITKSAGEFLRIKTLFHFSIIYVINQTLVFTALAYFINFAKQEERMNVLKQSKLQADLTYLKAQVQPHFFFNTLNNIYSLALQQSFETGPMIARLSEMMRYVIYETVAGQVSLQKEVDFLRNYVEVQSVRYNEKITIHFDAQGIKKSASIEPMLLLPFIENMFKHGVQDETDNGFIEIVIVLAENELTLQAKNSKPRVKIVVMDEPGIGLVNVKKRLHLLYPGKHSLLVNQSDNYYELLLTLQLS